MLHPHPENRNVQNAKGVRYLKIPEPTFNANTIINYYLCNNTKNGNGTITSKNLML